MRDGIIDIDEIDPWNSSTPAVIEFRDHFKNDQDMMDSQFNPFIRESTPPMVINIKVKTHEEWGWTTDFLIPLWVLKRSWSEIDVEAIDVANFSVTVRISPGRIAEFQGEGHEWFKAELDLFFWEVMGKYTVKIEMVDFAGNELDPAYEKEVDGWFGGVLRMLEALWEFICAVASAIADAVMAAINFIIDMLLSIINAALDAVVRPLVDGFNSWVDGIMNVVSSINHYETADAFADALFTIILGGSFFFLISALVIGVSVAEKVTMIATSGLGALVLNLFVPFVKDLLVVAVLALVGVIIGSALIYGLEKVEEIVPSGWPSAAKATFGIGKFVVKFGMYIGARRRGWESVDVVAGALKNAIAGMFLMIISHVVTGFIKDPKQEKAIKVLFDIAGIIMIHKLVDPALGKAKGPLSRFYPMLFPVSEALSYCAKLLGWGALVTDSLLLASEFE